MKFLENYKNMTILFALLSVISVILAVVTFPKEDVELEGQYEQVSVKVINVESKTGFIRFNRQTRYYITVEYNKEKYEMGPLSTAPYTQGGSYVMYLYEGKIYRTLDDLKSSARFEQTNLICRISLGIAFVSVIAFIGYLAAFLQNRKKPPLKHFKFYN